MQRAMRDFCAAQHIWYENSETPMWATDPELARNRVGDGLHANARWHAHSAELIVGNDPQRAWRMRGTPRGAAETPWQTARV